MASAALRVSGMGEREKREICSWKYEGEYSVYDLPDYEEMKAGNMGFMNPDREKNYRVFYHGDVLVGFANILEKPEEVFIGLGVKPDLCGMGYGRRILESVVSISKELYPEKTLCLEVRTWNGRAISCYLKAGFRIDGKPVFRHTPNGDCEFYRMVHG